MRRSGGRAPAGAGACGAVLLLLARPSQPLPQRKCYTRDVFRSAGSRWDYSPAFLPADCTSLDLGGLGSWDKVPDAGAAALGKALETNTALTTLRLDSNQIGDAGAEALGKALETNTALTRLYLHHNQIGDAGAAALGKGLETNAALTELWLSSNPIDGSTKEQLESLASTSRRQPPGGTCTAATRCADAGGSGPFSCRGGRCCPPGCLRCGTAGDCAECSPAYELRGGNCAPLPQPDGSACSADAFCVSAVCRGGKCRSFQDGAQCAAADHCASGSCRGGRCCGSKGKSDGCVGCRADGGCAECSPKYQLREARCAPRPQPDGLACSADAFCVSGACRGGRCCGLKGSSDGCARCDADGDCAQCSPRHELRKGMCAPLSQEAGAACSTDAFCGSGVCRGGRCCNRQFGSADGSTVCDKFGDARACSAGYALTVQPDGVTCTVAAAGKDEL